MLFDRAEIGIRIEGVDGYGDRRNVCKRPFGGRPYGAGIEICSSEVSAMVDATNDYVRLLRIEYIVYSELDAAGGCSAQLPPALSRLLAEFLHGDGALAEVYGH